MHTFVPGNLRVQVVRADGFSTTAHTPQPKLRGMTLRLANLLEEQRAKESPKPKQLPEIRGSLQMACNHVFNLPRSKAYWHGPYKFDDEVGKERRKCQHSNLRRRGRRAVEIFR